MALTDYNIPRNDWLPNGPWNHEDDREEFESSGLNCVLQRSRLGFWCGYVQLPTGHPWLTKAIDKINVSVYGGVKSVAAIPDKTGKWIAFECYESGDLAPGMMKWKRQSLADGVYRDFDFATAECEKLAAAVSAAIK